MRGSWNRKSPSGYEIVRIHFENGQPKTIELFVTGFLTDGGKTHIARPVGLAIAKDGSLLMADDANGVIYRIGKIGSAVANGPTAAISPPAETMKKQTAKASETIKLSSATIRPNASIPRKHSEYADGVSPPLAWSPVKGAKSYAIIAEDPDATPIKPFVMSSSLLTTRSRCRAR